MDVLEVDVLVPAVFTLALAGLVVVVSGIILYVKDQRAERGLLSLKSPHAPEIAFRSVLHARSAFTKAVQDYEQALVSESQMADLRGIAAVEAASEEGSENATTSLEDTESLEQTKDQKRARLLDAQRLWESVRPEPGPRSELDLWIGTGTLRAWQLGPIGREMVIVRFDHALDENCWVAWGARRLRIGFGLGAESQRMAMLAIGSSIDQLEDLTSESLDGGEIAIRPGFVPLRALRRVFTRPRMRRACAALLHGAGRPHTLANGPSADTREIVLAALLPQMDHDAADPGKLPVKRLKLITRTRGPSFLVGFWTGRKPALHVLARSNHGPWRVRSAAHR